MKTASLRTFFEWTQRAHCRLRLALWVVVLGVLATFAIAPGLFLDRSFLGPIPVVSWIPVPPPPVDLVILLALGGALVPVMWLWNPRPLLLIWCAAFFMRCVWDRMTWQPYLIQYGFMLLSFALLDWRDVKSNPVRQTAVLNTNRLILVCIYFWSGISKLNYASMVSGPRQLLAPLQETGLVPILRLLWMAAPLIEVGFALGLLSRRFRKLSIGVGIGMHVLILIIYGPLGYDHNPVVWPWNVAMIALLIILFGGDRKTDAVSLLRGNRFALQRIVLIVFGLCPLLSYAGFWSEYLSFRMYSHHYHHAVILMRQPSIDVLPKEVREHVQPSALKEWDGLLHVSHWGESQLNAFPPSDLAVSRHMAREIYRHCNEPIDMSFFIRYPPNVLTGKSRQEVIPCHQLMRKDR